MADEEAKPQESAPSPFPPNSEARSQYLLRLAELGRAQWGSLWALLVSGLFFLALELGWQVNPGVLQIGDLPLDSLVIQSAAPAVLSLLFLVFRGSMRAYSHGSAELGIRPPAGETLTPEQARLVTGYDVNPNPLDLVLFTPKKFEPGAGPLALLGYPIYTSLFVLEGAWLLWARWTHHPVGVAATLFVVSLIMSIWAVVEQVIFWIERIGRFANAQRRRA